MLGGPFILSFFLEPKGPISSGTQIHPVAARCTKDLLSDSLLRHPDYLSILSDSPLEILFMNLLGRVIILSTTRTVWWIFYLYAHIVPATSRSSFWYKRKALGKYFLLQLSYLAASGKLATRLPFCPHKDKQNSSRINHPKNRPLNSTCRKQAPSSHRDSRRGSLRILTCGPNGFCCPSATKCCFLCCSRHVSCDVISIQDKDILVETCVLGGATMEFITIESSSMWKMFGTSFGANLK